jgi:hypothetical protein
VVNLNINWSSLTYVAGDAISAKLQMLNASGLPPTDLAWILYRNNVQVASGNGRDIKFQTSSGGVYRLKATAGGATAESAVSVGGGFEIQASPTPPEVDPTCVYLGALYCDELTGSGGATATVPYQLASFTQRVYLLPGTTHISFDLDPLQNQVDDEVIVRTPLGNYTLKGYPSGLLDEQVGYDYTGGQPMLVAPADGILRLTIEAFNVHGDVASDFNFRVRVKCWRFGPAIYQYVRCPFTTFPGGAGKRDRQLAALFTQLEIQADVESNSNRFGTQETKTYRTPEVTTIPLTVLATDGAPNPVQAAQGYFFTDSNCYAVYEPDDDNLGELTAKAVSAQDGGLRPFYVTLQEPGDPPMIQRIKRLKGKMVVYMSQGGLTKGSVINARIMTGKLHNGQTEVTYQIPVEADVYNNNTDVFQRVAAIDIDLEDFQFSDNGVVVLFSVDETDADPEVLPCDDPDPVVPDEYLYTDLNAPAVVFDGACYTSPVVQPTVAAETHPVGGITGCHELICGPVGIYCYTDSTGSVFADFPQPLYYPSPYVAYGTDPLNCFSDPLLLYEVTGTGSNYTPLSGYSTDAFCGDGYVYEECDGAERSLVIYPDNTVPHDVVFFGSTCWALFSGTAVSGSVAQRIIGTLGWEVVSAGSVQAVASCVDDICTGTVVGGSSVVYYDAQTEQSLPVRFEGLDDGIPFMAVSAQVTDSGLGARPRGQKSVTFTTPRVFLFTCEEGGQVDFDFGLTDLAKRIIVIRGGETFRHEIKIGNTKRIVTLVAGDNVYADIGNQIGILSDRTRNKRTVIKWRPIISLPRQYHTAVLTTTGTNMVTGLGFTGRTNRDNYTRFETLPADVEQVFPNPDNIVTVQDATSPEYALVRTRAVGDPVSSLPGNTEWYAGQVLNDSLTFRFYTSREEQGAHGEMDVWLNNDGAFPVFFKVDPYRTLRFLGGDIDVLIMVSATSAFGDGIRSGVAEIHQQLINSGSDPRYAFVKCQPPPLNTAVASGLNFRTYETFSVLANWTDSDMPDNFGNPEAGLSTIWSAGTLFNWRDDAARLYIMVNNFSAWDFPPGFWEPSSPINYTRALATLTDNPSILFSIINPSANIPINPFTFVLPGNVPQTYMALAEQVGGKSYLLSQFGTEPGPIAQEIAMFAQSQFFATRVEDSITDISRNALRVTDSGTNFVWPNEYVATDGERISVLSSTGTILYANKVFVLLNEDSGISSRIVSSDAVVNYETSWFTTDHLLWETTDGETWTLE